MNRTLHSYELPTPAFFKSQPGGEPGRLRYQRSLDPAVTEKGLLELAPEWRKIHSIRHRENDTFKVLVIGIDYQDTFGHDGAELPVPGAVADSARFAEFLYRNMNVISDVMLTMDSHYLVHIFHPVFWVNSKGEHPAPFTIIDQNNVLTEWRPNPEICWMLGRSLAWLEDYVVHYVKKLAEPRIFTIKGQDRKRPRPPLVIWPIHSPLGGVGHALFPEVEKAAKFHQLCRFGRLTYRVKGLNSLTEAYSPFGDEVTVAHDGKAVGTESDEIIKAFFNYDMVVDAGEALTHCVRAGIYDQLDKVLRFDPSLAKKFYILRNCTSPVPGFEAQGQEGLQDFQDAGMNLVDSTTPIVEWPNVDVDKLLAGVA